eukprot:scpid5909/ scgid1277/ 
MVKLTVVNGVDVCILCQKIWVWLILQCSLCSENTVIHFQPQIDICLVYVHLWASLSFLPSYTVFHPCVVCRKCSQYAPSDKIKGPEKPSNPRPGVTFHPATIVSLVTEPELVQAQLSKDDILLHFIQLHRTMSAIERAEDEQGDVGVADEDDHRPQATVAAASASVQPGGEPAVNGIASEEIPAAAPPAAVAAAPISRHSRMSRSESSNSKKSTGKKRRKRDSTSDSDAQSVKSASSRGVMKRKRRRLCIVDSDEEDDDSGTEYLP